MKICEGCGREIEPRKKWEKNWDQIKYCSERCRRSKGQKGFETEILDLLQKRGRDKTICPSEVLPLDQKKDKLIMEQVRISARKLVAQGLIVIQQNGQNVDPSTAKGPIRLKLVRKA